MALDPTLGGKYPQLVLDNTFGALFIGVVVAGALWGVTCSQTFIYYRT